MGKCLAALVPAALLSLACTPQEHTVIQNFFTAVQGGDQSAVARVSVVKFPGPVTSWEIVEVGPESSEPFTLAALREELKEAEAELEKDKRKGEDFLQANAAKAEEYQKRLARNPNHKFTGDLAAFREEWENRMKTHEELTKKVEAARQRIIELRNAAGLSLNTSVSDGFEGAVKEKRVQLKVADGTEAKDYTLTLQRYELSDKERNLTPMSRWIVAGVDEEVSTAEAR